MFNAFLNIFRIPELRNKVLFTVGLLCIYRIGFAIPLPAVDQSSMVEHFQQQSNTGVGRVAEYFAIFTGGNLQRSSIFGLGIMPYISAAIIFQLLVTVVPALEKLRKEGESGQRKIQEYTRYATVGLCVIQAAFWMRYLKGSGLLYTEYESWILVWMFGIVGMTTGTMFLMWLGEQIDEYGIGNGISLIITAGIIARLPQAIAQVSQLADLSVNAEEGAMGPEKIIFLILSFVGVVAGAILLTQAQRRIPIQQAKVARGRRVYGGQRQYLPLRVNHGGVMPIIFASSLMVFPGMIFSQLLQAAHTNQWGWVTHLIGFFNDMFMRGTFTYCVVYILMVYFFAYFWTTVQFRPKEMSENLRDSGSFIPGLRTGKRTEEYLERVMERITYVGAGFLAAIALIPDLVSVWLNIPFTVSSFLGGTGLLIVVSVLLDFVQRVEANLVMRNYSGFLAESGVGRIKGAQ